MNNKRLGSAFEREFCEKLSQAGWWVHFMSPTASGAQPCDVIACRDNIPFLIDCKTCEDDTFRISRLEDNQIFAFEKFKKKGNKHCWIAVKHNGQIYGIPYDYLCNEKSVKLTDFLIWNFI